jgi:predicted ATPase
MSGATNFEAPTSAFIGREAELASLRRGFAEGSQRLTTLVGPAGIGKTRLALALGHALAESETFAGGVWQCDMREARDADDICGVVLRALDIKGVPEGGESLWRTVGKHLARRGRIVLIVDGLERVRAATHRTVGDWLRAAPDLRILATSRVRLALDGEAAFPVRSMNPADAERLWTERAGLVVPGYAVRSEDARAVSHVLEELDYLPLAIELAAARVGVLSILDIQDALGNRLDLLRGGGGSSPAPATSLETALRWSWQELESAERRALSQCACFLGGFDFAAAKAVIDLPAPSDRILDVIQSLTDKSMLHVETVDTPTQQRRFSLLRTMREFVLANAEPAALSDANVRHAEYYVPLAEKWLDDCATREDPVALHLLRLERQNLLGVATQADSEHSASRAVLALRASLALQPVAATWGPFLPQAELIAGRLHAARRLARPDATLQARSLVAQGRLDMVCRGPDAAKPVWNSALQLAIEAVNPELEGRAYHGLGACDHVAGELMQARASYLTAVKCLRGGKNQRALSWTLLDLGMLPEEIGEMGGALRAVDEANSIAVDLDDDIAAAALTARGCIHLSAGQPQETRRYLQQARDLCRENGYRALEGRSTAELGIASLLQHEAPIEKERAPRDDARALLGEGVQLLNDAGDRRTAVSYMGYRGVPDHLAGEHEQASGHYRRAIRLASELGSGRVARYFSGLNAVSLAQQGRIDEARRELAHASPSADADVQDARAFAPIRELAEAAQQLWFGKAALEEGFSEKAQSLFWSAQALIARGEKVGDLSAPVDIRIARLVLQGQRARAAAALGLGEDAERRQRRLRVGAEGRWFRFDAAKPVEIGPRRAVRRLLIVLSEGQRDSPGRALSAEALIGSLWPDEKISADSARNRLRVALSALRKAGLREHVLTREGGYLLDPSLRVLIVAEPA